jgi:phosphatidate cytidylyltransferase
MLVSFVLTQYFDDLQDWQWYVCGAIIVVAGTYGDLVESLFKRSIKIKDSASTIPGHGGFLDRFDGLLLSVPFIITFLKMF